MPSPAYPPTNPVYWPDSFSSLRPVLIPPPTLPCDDDETTPNPDCLEDPTDPEEPPMEVPEPGVIMILLGGLGVYWLRYRKRQRI